MAKSYSNWNPFAKVMFGLFTAGFGNILLKSVENVTNAVQEMKRESQASEKKFEDDLTSMGNEDDLTSTGNEDVLDTMNESFETTSENPFLSYRKGSSVPDFGADEDNPWNSWLNSKTGAGLTKNEKLKMMYQTWERQQAEAYNHNEAVDARMFDQYVAQNKYQWETQSMQAAGINPAMAYGGGSLVPTQATGAAGSVSPQSAPSGSNVGSLVGLIDVMTTLMRMPMELKSMSAELKSRQLDNKLKEKDLNWYDKKAGAGLENLNADTQTKIKSLEEADSRIRNNEMDTDLKRAQVSTEEARQAVEWAKYVQIGLSNELQEQLNPLLVQAQEYENELKHVESEYRERQILAALAETRAKTSALYAQAALDGARKQGVDIENKIKGEDVKFAVGNAQNRANLLRWTAYTSRQGLLQAKYQTQNAQYYAEHYEEAFRNSWSQSGVEWGITQSVGEAIGNLSLLGLMLAY